MQKEKHGKGSDIPIRMKCCRLLPKADIKALEALDLDVMATPEEIRERYKTLVKELHPDMNGGDRSEEERLQKAVAAWNHIKKSASFKR